MHLGDDLRTVSHLPHPTQVITKEEGGCSTWHYDGPSPRKKTVCDDNDKPTQVTDYNHPSTITGIQPPL
jgi:hypothetical protein